MFVFIAAVPIREMMLFIGTVCVYYCSTYYQAVRGGGVLDSVTSAPQCIGQPRPRVYLKEGTYHTRLFRGPSTNDMKKYKDGPSRSWPTPQNEVKDPPPQTIPAPTDENWT